MKTKNFDLKNLYVETVTSRINEHILESKTRKAKMKDLEESLNLYEKGKCPHNIVKYTGGWLYDSVECAICGKGLGVV
jgi:hypothetical protein